MLNFSLPAANLRIERSGRLSLASGHAWRLGVCILIALGLRMATFGNPNLFVDEAFYFEPENAEGFSNLRFVLRRLNHLNGAIASSRKRFAFGPISPKRITTSETLSQRLANRRLRQSDAAPS